MYPNTFQHPNLFIDKLAYFLTPEENTVLAKAVREMLGWQQANDDPYPQKRIARSIFVDGKFKSGQPKTEANRLCYGCGLNKAQVIKALAALDEYGVLIKVGNANNPNGQMYKLVMDSEAIDWAELEARKAKRRIAGKARSNLKQSTRPHYQDKSELVLTTRTSNSSSLSGQVTRPHYEDTKKPSEKPSKKITTTTVDVVFFENLKTLGIHPNNKTSKLEPDIVASWADAKRDNKPVPDIGLIISMCGNGYTYQQWLETESQNHPRRDDSLQTDAGRDLLKRAEAMGL